MSVVRETKKSPVKFHTMQTGSCFQLGDPREVERVTCMQKYSFSKISHHDQFYNYQTKNN